MAKYSAVTAVIFDLDGIILDTEPMSRDGWKRAAAKVGSIFREDGIGLRNDYKISGPELETMCDIARLLTA